MKRKLSLFTIALMMTAELGLAQPPYRERDHDDHRNHRDQRYAGSIDGRLDEVRESYRKGNFRDASARLRQLAAELDRMNALQKRPVFPKSVARWTLNKSARRNQRSGGFAITSHYQSGKKGLHATLHKGSDETINYIRSITRSSLLRRSKFATYNIQGYQAKLSPEGRLYIVIDRDTLLDLSYSDNDTKARDLIRFASALDIQRLRWAR